MNSSGRRSIPSVDAILRILSPQPLPRPAVVAIVRRELSALRRAGATPDRPAIVARIRQALREHARSRLQPVINGTGVLLHTNLGRAPLHEEAVKAVAALASSYCNLELDLHSGSRGGRASYLEHHLALLCRGESATVVNNGAAALILILRHFTARRQEVIISRGELIQIGGGFRIPEILETSGAVLKEIGTTNRTSVEDYERAVTPRTGLILKVHRSNFFMGGFVSSPSTEEIAALARRRRIPFVEDLGSGAVIATERLANVPHEPMPDEVLKRGVDLVCFSGDKLMGGPQAGIIAGRARHVARLKKEPFFRALRCDKLVLGALQATVDRYLTQDDKADGWPVPVADLISVPIESLERRADALLEALRDAPAVCRKTRAVSGFGGGALPQAELPSLTLDVRPQHGSPSELAARLRRGRPAVIGYVSGGRFRIDLRTVFSHQDAALAHCLLDALPDDPQSQFTEPSL
jgi:L-seryl-tRNA(Ser) seleniumtransferase